MVYGSSGPRVSRSRPSREQSRPSQVWNGWQNAEIYQEFIDEFEIYRALNRKLAEAADLRGARRVLDLGCGTGATTLTCLETLDPEAEIVGLDAAEAMVEVARARIADPRVDFVVAPAGRIADAVGGQFDRVVCNAALWLFPNRSTLLGELARSVEAGGLLVFNTPSERMLDIRVDPHPFQHAFASALALAGGEAPVERSAQIDPAELVSELEQAGFSLEDRFEYDYRTRQEELMELMEIPAMLARAAAHLEPKARARALATARQMVDPDLEVSVPWSYFVARKIPPRPPLQRGE